MTKYEEDILNRIEELIHKGKLNNNFLVSNLKLSADYLNLQRIKDAAKENGITPQGFRKFHKSKIIKLCNYQFAYDND